MEHEEYERLAGRMDPGMRIFMDWGFYPGSMGGGGGQTLLTADVTELQAGQDVAFTLALESRGSQTAGINAGKEMLEYDREAFEAPAQKDFEVLGGWNNVTYNPENGKFAVISWIEHPGDRNVLRVT